MIRRGLTAVILVLTIGAAVHATAFPIVRVSGAATNVIGDATQFRRDPFTSRGKILFVDGDHGVWLFDGTLPPDADLVEPRPDMDNVRDTVFMLGPGGVAPQVYGGWRRADGYARVSVDGAPPSTVDLNPEAVSIADGCMFMVLQNGSAGNHLFQIDPSSGTRTQLSSGMFGANFGAFRVVSGNCRAVYTVMLNGSTAQELRLWNGTMNVALEPDAARPRMSGNLVVYTKIVSGVEQVFVVDVTDPLLTKVQLSHHDATKTVSHVETDGSHVAWMRANLDGSNRELVLGADLVFPTGAVEVFSNERSFLLDRGQLLWMSPAGALSFDDGLETHALDLAPVTRVGMPWLVDGFLAFRGLEDGNANQGMFRMALPPPEDEQPMAPLFVRLTADGNALTVEWDPNFVATSYNLYLASEPGLTKDNYASLEGGVRITGATSPHTIVLPTRRIWYAAVTAVDGGDEGPSSRVASSFLPGDLTWQQVSAGSFFSVAADPSNASRLYAGSNGAVHRSSNGGLAWSPVLPAATTGSNRIAAMTAGTAGAFAVASDLGDVWRSTNGGTDWTRVLEADSTGEQRGAIAIDPATPNTLYAGNFILDGMDSERNDSYVIRSTNGGTDWAHTAEGPDELRAYAIAIVPGSPARVVAGGSGTPNLAASTDGGEAWSSTEIPSGGTVHALAVDPNDPDVMFAGMRDKGVFRTRDGGGSWAAVNDGLDGVSDDFFGGAGFNALIVDPRNSNYLHLGAGNGYWYSLDQGESWTAANDGFTSVPEILGLALTADYRLIAATSGGLHLLSVAPPPAVASIAPATGDVAGGTSVTISGTGFQSGAGVTFGGVAATGVTVVSATSITAVTPPHAAGAVAVTVTNFDGQSGTKAAGFTYTTTPPATPTGVLATATTTSSVLVTWNAAARATSYTIHRRSSGTGFVQVGTSATTSFTNTGLTPATAHLYRVEAVNSAGTSAASAADIATTVLFTDEPIVVKSTKVRAAHVAQLRSATNAVRALAGLGPFTFTGSAAVGTPIVAGHVSEMRTALDAALSLLGRPTGGYTDATLTGQTVKAAHLQELRNRVK